MLLLQPVATAGQNHRRCNGSQCHMLMSPCSAACMHAASSMGCCRAALARGPKRGSGTTLAAEDTQTGVHACTCTCMQAEKIMYMQGTAAAHSHNRDAANKCDSALASKAHVVLPCKPTCTWMNPCTHACCGTGRERAALRGDQRVRACTDSPAGRLIATHTTRRAHTAKPPRDRTPNTMSTTETDPQHIATSALCSSHFIFHSNRFTITIG